MVHRRAFLQGLGLLGCSAAAAPWLTTVTLAGAADGRVFGDHRLVVIILRGAMDGLDVVQPHGAPEYAGLRPTLLQPGAPDLDGYFRLHPALSGLMPLWQAGEVGFVHATSTPYRDKRSHFVGQDILEAGTGTDVPPQYARNGWLNRLLQTQSGLTSETAYTVGIEALPMLEGPAPVREWSPETKLALSPQARLLLAQVYQDDPLFQSTALAAMQLADQQAAADAMLPAPAPALAPGGAQVKLADLARLVDYAAARLRQDTRIAAFSLSGWDTHKAQSAGLPVSLGKLQLAILQLQTGLGPEVWSKTTVLAMTEFGRTARENGTQGTDHGTAGVMVMAGGALRGGKVYGRWPGLADGDLYQQRDLMPTSDVRAWAAHAMRGMYGIDRAVMETMVFPGLQMGDDPAILR